MSWLEENVREVLQAVDSGDPAVAACESRWAWGPVGAKGAAPGLVGGEALCSGWWSQGSPWGQGGLCATSLLRLSFPDLRRKMLYQRAPRNIHRHVVLSEVKEAVAALPPVRERAWKRGLCRPRALPSQLGF